MIRYRVDVEWSGKLGFFVRSNWFYKEESANKFVIRLCSCLPDEATDVFNDSAGYADGTYVSVVGVYKVTEEKL